MAVATGTANAVVCYRAFNERSGFRFGGATARPSGETPLWLAQYAPLKWKSLSTQKIRPARV